MVGNAAGSEFGLNDVLEFSRAFAWEVDSAGIYTRIMGPVEAILGFRKETLIGKYHYFDLHPEEGREAFRKASEKLLLTGERINDLVNPVQHADGGILWMSTNAVPVRDSEGRVCGYRGIDLDITSRIEAVESLSASEKKWRSYVDRAPYGVCVVDGQGRYLEVNPAMSIITGYSEERLLKMSILDLVPEEAREMAIEHGRRVKVEGYAFAELPFLLASGRTGWWSVAATRLSGNAFIGFHMDVTERIESEQWNRRLVAAVEQGGEGIAISDMEGRVIYMNRSWRDQHGIDDESEYLGKSLERFHTEEQIEKEVLPSLERLRQEGKDFCEVNHLRADGTQFPMSMNLAIVYDSRGRPFGMIGIGRDLTETRNRQAEEKRLTDELVSHNRALAEFTYVTAHNIRGPLTNLLSLCDLAHDECGDNPRMDKLLEGIEKSSRQLGSTVEELTRILEIKTKPRHQLAYVGFAKVLSEVKRDLTNQLLFSEVEFETDFSEVEGVFFDEASLRSIFQHLISNAVQYRSPKRPLKISLRSSLQSGRKELIFSDNGTGLDLTKAGDKLYGLHQRFHENSSMRGVGLFLVRTQLNSLGANIDTRGGPDEGLSFTITFAADSG